MLSKSENIAKTMEGCSKSHFSHICKEVEQMILRPLILDRFLDPKSAQDREKVVSKSLRKSTQNFMTFLQNSGTIWVPRSHLEILRFSYFLGLAVALGPSWLQEGAQSATRQLQGSIFQEFCTILGSISKESLKSSRRILVQLPG